MANGIAVIDYKDFKQMLQTDVWPEVSRSRHKKCTLRKCWSLFDDS